MQQTHSCFCGTTIMTTLTVAHRSAAAAIKHRPAGSLVHHLRKRQTALAAQILPASTPDKQIYICNGKPIEVNINPVQRMPMAGQFGVFCAWMGGMAVGAYLLATRTNMQWAQTAAAHNTLVALFIGVGTAHFVPFFHHAMCTMIPIQVQRVGNINGDAASHKHLPACVEQHPATCICSTDSVLTSIRN